MIYHTRCILRYAVCNQMCTRCCRCKNLHSQHILNATAIICTPGEKLENDRPKIPTRSVFVQFVYEVIHKNKLFTKIQCECVGAMGRAHWTQIEIGETNSLE